MDILVLGWLSGGVMVAVAAAAKGHNWGMWILYGLALFPVALIHILATPATDQAIGEVSDRTKACPDCFGYIKPRARFCMHCGQNQERDDG